ncbi:ubiquitin-like protein ISG15 [Rhinatrema bivittatum]|uniref:ubiquitin-like protein ISG15 n=1 Tax=Rhinatrema bivittatum TaxID=194408 RepID=UPI00112835D0|nr:ubiquitin-like protein ISG15 [Rhinatrema bivittatum]
MQRAGRMETETQQFHSPSPISAPPPAKLGGSAASYIRGRLLEKSAERRERRKLKESPRSLPLKAASRHLMMMNLNVKLLTGEVHTLVASASMSISTLRSQIASKTGVPSYQQKLGIRDGNGEFTELRDSSQLSEYNLSSGDTILLMVKADEPIDVFLSKDNGRRCNYTIYPSEGVTEFKARVQTQERIQPGQFWLSYESKTLEDGHKLGEYNIAPSSFIYMHLRLRGGGA